MENKTVVYTGIRLDHGNKKQYRYLNIENGEIYMFARLIGKSESIGTLVESEVEGSTFSKSKIVGILDPSNKLNEHRSEWHLQNRLALERLQMISDCKKFKDDPVEKLVNDLRNHMYSMTKCEKTRIARYVFEKLMN